MRLVILLLSFCAFFQKPSKSSDKEELPVLKIGMTLDAFGVESDHFPSIKAILDFKNNSSICKRSYYNPVYKDSTYTLTKTEMATISNFLKKTDIKTFAKNYKEDVSDQPTSTMIIYTNKDTIHFEDYGLIGEHPLDEIYKIVYKLHVNFR